MHDNFTWGLQFPFFGTVSRSRPHADNFITVSQRADNFNHTTLKAYLTRRKLPADQSTTSPATTAR